MEKDIFHREMVAAHNEEIEMENEEIEDNWGEPERKPNYPKASDAPW